MAAIVATHTIGLSASTGSVTMTRPTGAVAGDMLLAFHCTDFGAASGMTAPSGWTQLALIDPTGGGSSSGIRIKLWKADGAVASVSPFSDTGPADSVVIMCRITGHDSAATPITASNGSLTAITTPFDAPSVTPAGADDLLLCAAGAEPQTVNHTITWTDPAGTTRVDAGQPTLWTSMDLVSQALASSAATGVRTFTPAGPANWIWASMSVAVKSAAGGGAVTKQETRIRNRARFRAAIW